MDIQKLNKKQYQKIEDKLNVHPLQSYAWGDLKSPVWSPIRLGLYEGDEVIAVVNILTRSIPIVGKKFGYVPRGITVKEGKSLEEVLKQIRDYGKRVKLTHLIVDPDLNFKFRITNEELMSVFQEVGFTESGDQIQPNRTVVLDLSKSEKQLLADMRSKHRQYIRKAGRNGVKIRHGDQGDIDSFCKIIEEIGKERKYVLHSCDYYKKVWELFSAQGNAKLFVAEKEGEIVGSYMLILSLLNAYEMFGGCNSKGNTLLANYLMKWEAIRYCKEIVKEFYDQWGAEFKYAGLVQFKEGFGGEIVEFPPQYTLVYDSLGYALYKVLNKVNEFRQRV